MIAVAYDSVIEVKLSDDPGEAKIDQGRLKAIRPKDRHYDEFKRVWVVKNIYRYREVDFIKNALRLKYQQPSLLEGIWKSS